MMCRGVCAMMHVCRATGTLLPTLGLQSQTQVARLPRLAASQAVYQINRYVPIH